MSRYEYQIDYIQPSVKDSEVMAGKAGGKITAQIELKFTEWGEKGFEFYSSEGIPFEVKKTNCFGTPTGEVYRLHLLVFLFRREIK